MASFSLSAADLSFVREHDILISRYDQAYSNKYFVQLMSDPLFRGRRAADFGNWADYGDAYRQIVPYFQALDLAFISGNQQTIDLLGPLATAHELLLVVTMGQDGCIAVPADGPPHHQPAFQVENVVDTTGAGDAFQAAFVVAYQHTGQIPAALLAGVKNAARAVQHFGATGF
jgi:sugar/nucleoside kinase (ribokinase family)